jgi:ribose-phosphate pyrophosphokinase
LRAEELADLVKTRPEVAWIDKVRPHPNVAIAKRLHGDVQGKKVLIADDMIDTGGTLSEAVKLVSQKGAQSIRLASTHGIFSGEEVLITNTLPRSGIKRFI